MNYGMACPAPMQAETITPASKRRELVDCFNCSVSHRVCDRTSQRCLTCVRVSETCGGYPREWQWLTGIKSRGKQKGQPISITTSGREWQSTTPVNRVFVFKKGAPKRKRVKPGSQRLKGNRATEDYFNDFANDTESDNDNKSKRSSSLMSPPVGFCNRQESNLLGFTQCEQVFPTLVSDYSHNVPLISWSPSSYTESGDNPLYDPAFLEQIDPTFSSSYPLFNHEIAPADSDFLGQIEIPSPSDNHRSSLHPDAADSASPERLTGMASSPDQPMQEDLKTDNDSMLMSTDPTQFTWPNDSTPVSLSILNRLPTPRLSVYSPSTLAMETSKLVLLYNSELCLLPLTHDFGANPLRCMSPNSLHSVHAVLAFALKYLGRMNDASVESLSGQQVMEYRDSATNLCKSALTTTTSRLNDPVIDTTLILFNLDSLTSAAGPWNERLATALQRIESLGGLSALSASPRIHAQLTLFVWWDCNMSLVTRTKPVFPSQYHDFVISCDDDNASDVFALSGVAKELFQHFRELALLATEKEQVSKMTYATFDTTRVLKIEQCIRDFTVEECKPGTGEDTEDRLHEWYDYYHGSNVWRYGLLLYISRVLKWDRLGDPNRQEITSLARLVLDSVRCCREDSKMRKQFLYPVFLAGAECSDSYSRKFVVKYLEELHQWSRYAMFKEALELLRETWQQRDNNNNDRRIWWGSVLSTRSSNASQLLLA